ncbi:2-amino-4-hydroxy-6-hydroxymethyldihydropteridine diphosphokinase [Alicyclobacillus pomorum]|jgi:2-amino-4-hydroxy-6-hydroxymethyldihydropteridine diphosphokinase|uniref:2-amino-4-hydroxy-6- hydroxymethyldihydropteridine diphosphokinase n=1 Tax=Alicyclobacillus pomorum TaxID=204470 RepID=UPI00047C46A0|nr:2-amino-4-hydroxy-6-hydroxymethyldihydropteridine diphosphokinase [Alicyclobacillus pomorum]
MNEQRTFETHTAYVALGSNLGRREAFLKSAVECLRTMGSIQCSSVYETEPVGYTEQPPFLNMVVELQTTLPPLELLNQLLAIEREHGRTRDIRFGPRTLDLDLLLYDDEYICLRMLQVPHPRMWERAFVLVPLAELVPHRRGLGGSSIKSLAEQIAREGEIRRVGHLR